MLREQQGDDDAQQQSQRNGGDDVGQQAADILAHQRAELAHAAYLVIQDEQRQVDKDAQCGEQQGKAKGGQRGQVIRHARQQQRQPARADGNKDIPCIEQLLAGLTGQWPVIMLGGGVLHHGEKRRYPEQNHRQRRSARYGAGQYGHEADLQRFVFREINGQHPAHHHQQHHHQAVAPDIPAATARQIIRIYLPKGKQKNRQPRNGDGGRIYPQLFFVHSRFPPGAGLRHTQPGAKCAVF